ncbi:MAG: protoporphyrinogen oxidase [Myxococcota bacterium]
MTELRQAEVVVIGAGIAGLACATELLENGRDVVVVEAASRAGGPVDTARHGEIVVERGPQTVRATPALTLAFERAGLRPVQAARRPPYVLTNGELIRMPPGLRDLARGRPLSPWALLAGVLGEPFRRHPPGPRTVRRMVEERFGERIAAVLSDALTLGVYSQPSDRIGFESAYPELADDLDRHGSLLLTGLARRFRRGPKEPRGATITAAGGLATLMDRLADRLGERLHLDTPAIAVERSGGSFRIETGGTPSQLEGRHVVLAVPPPQAARMLAGSRAAPLLAQTAMAPQTLAIFASKDAAAVERWQSLGFLVPAREKLPLIGCLFPSALFPDRAPLDVLLMTVFIGPALRDATDATIAHEVGRILSRLLRTSRPPDLLEACRHPVGIPIYDRRHRDRTRAARRHLADEQGPLLAGAGYDGVGFGAAATSGIRAAEEIFLRS